MWTGRWKFLLHNSLKRKKKKKPKRKVRAEINPTGV